MAAARIQFQIEHWIIYGALCVCVCVPRHACTPTRLFVCLLVALEIYCECTSYSLHFLSFCGHFNKFASHLSIHFFSFSVQLCVRRPFLHRMHRLLRRNKRKSIWNYLFAKFMSCHLPLEWLFCRRRAFTLVFDRWRRCICGNSYSHRCHYWMHLCAEMQMTIHLKYDSVVFDRLPRITKKNNCFSMFTPKSLRSNHHRPSMFRSTEKLLWKISVSISI